MAMHIHSSFSEQQGSMDAQLCQAAQSLVDVLWWTDHDQRMTGLGYRDTVHFTSLDAEQPDPGQGKAWHWTPAHSGRLASYSGGIVASPCSPNDPVAGGALAVSAQSSKGSAGYGYYANSGPSDLNYRDNLTGQSQSIDVLLGPGWSNGYAELAITTSAHPSGQYALSYRLVPGNGPRGQLRSVHLTLAV